MLKLESDILGILQEDCRYTAAKIAVMLNKTEKEIADTISSMESRGIIVKYTAIVNDERLSDDIVQALIEVKVSPQKTSGFDAIAEEVYRFEEVKSCYLMSGGYDLAVFIEGKNLREVARFVSSVEDDFHNRENMVDCLIDEISQCIDADIPRIMEFVQNCCKKFC